MVLRVLATFTKGKWQILSVIPQSYLIIHKSLSPKKEITVCFQSLKTRIETLEEETPHQEGDKSFNPNLANCNPNSQNESKFSYKVLTEACD